MSDRAVIQCVNFTPKRKKFFKRPFKKPCKLIVVKKTKKVVVIAIICH